RRCAAGCCRSRCAARGGTPRALPPGFLCPRRVGRVGRVSYRGENEVSGEKTLVELVAQSARLNGSVRRGGGTLQPRRVRPSADRFPPRVPRVPGTFRLDPPFDRDA